MLKLGQKSDKVLGNWDDPGGRLVYLVAIKHRGSAQIRANAKWLPLHMELSFISHREGIGKKDYSF